jgi:hypothetical protein
MTPTPAFQKKLLALLPSPEKLASYLISESGLPGPRSNLGLASAFGDLAADGTVGSSWVETLLLWTSTSPEQAPTNHPREFLPFVAIQALGARYCLEPGPVQGKIESAIRASAKDLRWRMREGCVFGLQRIGNQDPARLIQLLESWLPSACLLELRAVIATLADPPLLKEKSLSTFALSAAETAIQAYRNLSPEMRRDEAAAVLRKGLEYAPSVFVAASPTEGFRMLENWADSGQVEVAKVVAANLRKARLAKHYPEQVEEVGLRLQAAFPM